MADKTKRFRTYASEHRLEQSRLINRSAEHARELRAAREDEGTNIPVRIRNYR